MGLGVAPALLLGVLQGVTEWLPVSSQGVVTLVHAALFDRPLSEAAAYALWLHVGTSLAALLALRHRVRDVLCDAIGGWRNPAPQLRFLAVATLASAIVGVPLLLAFGELSERVGALGMTVVGLALLVTGALQLRRGKGDAAAGDARGRDDLTTTDALLAGVAQGLAALPGLSRSGLTVAALLGRRIDRSEALALSYLMSIPASLGAGLFALADGGVALAWPVLLAAAVACGVGLLTIRALLAFAQRVNLGGFALAAGALTLAAAIWGVVG